MLKVSFSRVYWFSSAHRLHSESLDDNMNLEVYDKCNNFNGHGHDYKLEVTLQGEPDQVTGMVYSMQEFDDNVHSVIDTIDHKHLDKEVAHFHFQISTGEHIIHYLWDELFKKFEAGLLFQLKLWETNNNYFELGKENV